jgi:hypothetical protein
MKKVPVLLAVVLTTGSALAQTGDVPLHRPRPTTAQPPRYDCWSQRSPIKNSIAEYAVLRCKPPKEPETQ